MKYSIAMTSEELHLSPRHLLALVADRHQLTSYSWLRGTSRTRANELAWPLSPIPTRWRGRPPRSLELARGAAGRRPRSRSGIVRPR